MPQPAPPGIEMLHYLLDGMLVVVHVDVYSETELARGRTPAATLAFSTLIAYRRVLDGVAPGAWQAPVSSDQEFDRVIEKPRPRAGSTAFIPERRFLLEWVTGEMQMLSSVSYVEPAATAATL